MRQSLVSLLCFVLLSLYSGCSSDAKTESILTSEATTKSQDRYPQRIITLAPHLAELVSSLGAEDRIIATVDYTDYPDAAQNIPRIGDAFRIDWERLAQLKPDLILVWEGGNPQSMLDELRRREFPVLALKNPRLFELPEQLMLIADSLGVIEGVADMSEEYSAGLSRLQETYSNKALVKVFYQIAPEPLYTIDGEHVISEMLKLCGAENVFGDIGSIAAPVSAEAMLAERPDVILTTHEMHAAIVDNWSVTSLIDPNDILSVSADEVARASLRMLQGANNICEVLDEWRAVNNK